MKGRNIIVLLALSLLLSCGNSKKEGRHLPTYGSGDGLPEVELLKPERTDTAIFDDEKAEKAAVPKGSGSSASQPRQDNMRGFDPASENDMDDNGMRRFMENNDDEGWD